MHCAGDLLTLNVSFTSSVIQLHISLLDLNLLSLPTFGAYSVYLRSINFPSSSFQSTKIVEII